MGTAAVALSKAALTSGGILGRGLLMARVRTCRKDAHRALPSRVPAIPLSLDLSERASTVGRKLTSVAESASKRLWLKAIGQVSPERHARGWWVWVDGSVAFKVVSDPVGGVGSVVDDVGLVQGKDRARPVLGIGGQAAVAKEGHKAGHLGKASAGDALPSFVIVGPLPQEAGQKLSWCTS